MREQARRARQDPNYLIGFGTALMCFVTWTTPEFNAGILSCRHCCRSLSDWSPAHLPIPISTITDFMTLEHKDNLRTIEIVKTSTCPFEFQAVSGPALGTLRDESTGVEGFGISFLPFYLTFLIVLLENRYCPNNTSFSWNSPAPPKLHPT